MNRPETNEFAPYYNNYVSLVTDGPIATVLEAQPGELSRLISGLPEEKGVFAYAEGKWTIKELLSHLIDGERIFAYRVLRISRGDKTPIGQNVARSGVRRSNFLPLKALPNALPRSRGVSTIIA